MNAPTIVAAPAPRFDRRRRSGLLRRLGALGVTATLTLGVLGTFTAQGGVEARGHPRRTVVTLVNQRRVAAGLPRLRMQGDLLDAAQRHSRYQARVRRMSHIGAGGTDCGQRIAREGYRWSAWGENVAAGYAGPRAVMRGWMHSPGHRANILNGSFTEIGVGLAWARDGTPYWTMVLARPA